MRYNHEKSNLRFKLVHLAVLNNLLHVCAYLSTISAYQYYNNIVKLREEYYKYTSRVASLRATSDVYL